MPLCETNNILQKALSTEDKWMSLLQSFVFSQLWFWQGITFNKHMLIAPLRYPFTLIYS